ncbi:hypothetical protein [Spirosoma sordidisoli]|uniref:Uncharacterized protein n=1 Tax=Spirosoma sordidisoli TaxID=2502893 RepID=A0A4Q2UJM5_9BACT|nr:hypothetical protein [Spirosoma sordidisoli]RYC68822.1 hypothetical protein EQG79_15500 [Spirosoma sordidisoli]
MITYLIGACLAVSLAQADPQSPKQTGSTKAASGSATAATAKPASATAPARPLPDHPLSTKLQDENNSNPYYRKEKASGRGTKREYTPRRTASGARQDTMNQRRP